MAGELLFEAGVMFAAIAAVSIVAARAGLSPIPFYILVGMALNEYVVGSVGLPYVSETAFIEVGAELGIVFLLFFLGLEFNLETLLRDRERIGKAGVADFVVNFAVGLLFGVWLFDSVVAALVVAGIVYISSSAVITKTMLDVGWIANPESAPILGTLVFEDLAIAVYLAVLGAAVLGGGSLATAAESVGIAVGFLFLLVVLVYAGTGWLERLLDTPSSEYFVLRTVGTTVLIAGAALALGVSEAVAAFFVGMAFSSTSFVHAIEESLTPIRDTFAAVFFFWIGLVTDPFSFLGVLDLIALAVLVTLPSKLLSGYYSGRLYELTDQRSLRVGLAMVTRGEFSLIIAATALAGAGATLPTATAETIYAFTVGYVLVMSILGTTLIQFAPSIERHLPTT
ncbi:cation:proton antiporter [Salarchaeum sp. JOR-1]|uniref:cation:proton antiporter n=1 Tax=Salarchaeum sp. JOR-1 TaxID=2599399 RepID=UPI00119834EB|nr:cation:proton antiporter [Salarchaeum sp. JOR-1]QDX41007.1 cation:proton antiporter [Salarchaeum sp. JOR-1]